MFRRLRSGALRAACLLILTSTLRGEMARAAWCSMLFARMTFLKSLKDFYSAQDIAEIRNLLEKHPEDSEVLYRQVFGIYARALGRRFEDSGLRDRLGHFPIVSVEGNEIVANTWQMSVPRALMDSPFTFGVAAHELVHKSGALQFVHENPRINFRYRLQGFRIVWDPIFRTFDEGKAMYGEWLFLRQIPRERRLKWSQHPASEPLDPFYQSLLASMMEKVDLDFPQYLEHNYDNLHRYSLITNLWSAFLPKPGDSASAFVVKAFLSSGALLYGARNVSRLFCPKLTDPGIEFLPAYVRQICFGNANARSAPKSVTGESDR